MNKIKSHLHKDEMVTITQLLRLFRQVDKEVEYFKKNTGIHCPPMCGTCCADSDVETTVVEMLPLAVQLWLDNEADIWLERISRWRQDGRCIFFKPFSPESKNGRCRIYRLRPIICRLFGFFTVKDKYGNYVYGSCKIIKNEYSEIYQKTRRLVQEGFHPSNMTNFAIRVISMGSELSRKMLPINVAAKIALEKVGFDLEKKILRGKIKNLS